jgi:H+/Cl- antiporter ClcA
MKPVGRETSALSLIHSALVNWLRQHAALLLGAMSVGTVAFSYARLIDFGYARFLAFHSSHPLASLAVVPCVAALATWITRSQFIGAEGSGIPQVVAAVQSADDSTSARLLSARVMVGKIMVSFLAALGGLTIGREGPSVQVGAALMLHAKKLFPTTRVTDRQLILAGGAAGLAASFNAPFAGFAFAIEGLARRYDARTGIVVTAGVAIAAMAGICLSGGHSSLPRVDSTFPLREWLPAIFVCGLMTGISGGGLAWLFTNIPKWLPAPLGRLRENRPVLFAAVCGVAVSIAGQASGGTSFGSGFGQAGAILQGHSPSAGKGDLSRDVVRCGYSGRNIFPHARHRRRAGKPRAFRIQRDSPVATSDPLNGRTPGRRHAHTGDVIHRRGRDDRGIPARCAAHGDRVSGEQNIQGVRRASV